MIRRRLLFGLVTLGLMVAVTAAVGLASHEALHDQLDDVAAAEREMAAALWLSIAVRDVYAHQAHSVVLNDRSHLAHYQPALQDAKNLALALDGLLLRSPERPLVVDIRARLAALDDNFRDAIVPRLGGPREALIRPHDEALAQTDALGAVIDRLTNAVRARVDAAQHDADAGRHTEVVLLAVVLLCASAIAWVVGRRLVSALGPPLAALESGARRFATGDLSHRIQVEGDDELAALARQMNAMAAQLDDHGRRLLESERLASLGRIAAAVAHEVNNPLAAISGYTQVVERELTGSGHRDRVGPDLARIKDEAERCREIVAGLLDLSRPPKMSRFPTDLGELARDTVEALRHAGHRGEVVVIAPPGLPEVELDPLRVRQILLNLLRNALEAGSRAELGIDCDETHLTLTITDDGPGIAPENAATLFEPFATTKPNGTGLGLAISRALARAHGGDVSLDPDAVGGARFVVTLPRVTPEETHR